MPKTQTKTKMPDPMLFDSLFMAVEPAKVDVMSLTVGDLLRTIAVPGYAVEYAMKKTSDTLDAARTAKGLIEAVRGLLEYAGKLQPEPTEDEKRAAIGVEFPSFAEGVLLDCVTFYHLHSTDEAERLPVADWFMMYKQASARGRYERNYNKIIEKKQNGTQHV